MSLIELSWTAKNRNMVIFWVNVTNISTSERKIKEENFQRIERST